MSSGGNSYFLHMEMYRIDPQNPDKDVVKKTADILKKGAVVAHPTETVYGLAANIYDEAAVQKIYDIKGRRTAKPLSLMVDNITTVEEIVGGISPFARKFMEHFLPGSVTVVLPFKKKVDIPFFENRETIGFRIPDYPFCLELLKEVGVPLTTTSANKSGASNPVLAVEVMTHFNNDIDILIDAGKTENGLPSTVVDLSGDSIKILREGAVPNHIIQEFLME